MFSDDEVLKELSDAETLYLTIIGEARGESIEGQVAVANVILNRARVRKQTVKQVCLAPRQFSCWNSSDLNRILLMNLARRIVNSDDTNYTAYPQIGWVVEGALGKKLLDNVKGRDHYMTNSLYNSDRRPSWARVPKTDPIVIGNHTFLNV